MRTLIFFIYILIPAVHIFSPVQEARAQNDHQQKREQMVEKQIRARGITDPDILDAFLQVERHWFVPEELKEMAYNDSPLPIGEGQTISQPYVVAFMTQHLQIKPSQKVLEIGTGSGYQTAILAELKAEVYSIEIIENLALKAEEILNSIGYTNIHLNIGDGYQGWAEFAPYDAIIVTCAPSKIPEPLIEQLSDNGKMIIPVGERGSVQELILLEKKKGRIKQKGILPVRFVPMINELKETY